METSNFRCERRMETNEESRNLGTCIARHRPRPGPLRGRCILNITLAHAQAHNNSTMFVPANIPITLAHKSRLQTFTSHSLVQRVSLKIEKGLDVVLPIVIRGLAMQVPFI